MKYKWVLHLGYFDEILESGYGNYFITEATKHRGTLAYNEPSFRNSVIHYS